MATETLRPNAAGDETGVLYQYPDSGAHWDKVDEATPDYDTYIYHWHDYYARDLYNLPASSIPDGATINFVKIYFRCFKNYATAAYAKPSLKSDSTTTDGTEVELTDSWVTYSQQWNTNPADGQPWEKSDIDALQIGVSLKGSGVDSSSIVTQVYVEIDYTPVTEKASSDAGSGAEGTPALSTVLAGSESGSGIEALFTRLLAALDNGTSAEASEIGGGGLLKNLLATELGEGSDSLTAKIEMPTKGGGMKLWT